MGNQASVKNHVENAQRTGVFQLTKANLTEFPKDVSKLKNNIRSLDLSFNKLKSIPGLIGEFSNLRCLSLNNNRLVELPPEVGSLKKLETLTLNSNCLSSLPPTLADCSNLRVVNLSENKLTVFPTVFLNLKHLDVLDLSRNRINEIPSGVQNLYVSELNMNQNQISTISDDIADAPRLKVLRIEENCLQLGSIPTRLLTDSQVSLLATDGNLFGMKEMQELNGFEKYMERYTATKKKLM